MTKEIFSPTNPTTLDEGNKDSTSKLIPWKQEPKSMITGMIFLKKNSNVQDPAAIIINRKILGGDLDDSYKLIIFMEPFWQSSMTAFSWFREENSNISEIKKKTKLYQKHTSNPLQTGEERQDKLSFDSI